MSKAKEDIGKSDKRPPSSMSTGSADSGVFSSGVHVSSPSHSQRSEGSSAGSPSGPPSPTTHLNSLLFETANLIAVNEQLRKEIAENKQIQNIQMRALNRLSKPPTDNCQPFIGSLVSPQFPGFPQRAPRGERRMQKPESYKTVICQAWLESKTCTFAENCRFAHGEEELRPSKIEPRQNNKYKTKLCDKYTTTGLCPYGKRCLFIHPDHGPNAYIRADKLYEVSQRHALADLRDHMETQIMTGSGKNSFSQLPSLIPETQHSNQHSNRIRSPIQQCEVGRPHPSWPLESSGFFLPPETSINNNHSMSNPFDSTFNGSTSIQPYFVTAKQSTPSFPSLSTNSRSQQSDDDSMSTIPGFDHLAEDMAKHLELW
uniref:C3H1-type domain-containing protein n=1 Tax=Caenorhabditis tropicalis TaxID=1561998 RepID=A0A1I7UC47_9PELO